MGALARLPRITSLSCVHRRQGLIPDIWGSIGRGGEGVRDPGTGPWGVGTRRQLGVDGGACACRDPSSIQNKRRDRARPCPQSMGPPRVPARNVLFQSERSGLTYRVPALLPVPPGPTLLAFAEQRLRPDDTHAHRLVQRRGTLSGASVLVRDWAGDGAEVGAPCVRPGN